MQLPFYKICSITAAGLYLASCQSSYVEVPESVAGRTLEFSFANGEVVSFYFASGNVITYPEIPSGYGNRVEYKKNNSHKASLECEVWESMGSYSMQFTSPDKGAATYTGVIEGMEENERNISFILK